MKIPTVSNVVKPLLGIAARSGGFSVQNTMIEKMLRGAFSGALAEGDFDVLEDRCVALDIPDVNYRIAFGLCQNRLLVLDRSQPADVVIRGELREFIHLAARREEPGTLFRQQRLCLEGDNKLALAVKKLMDGADLDAMPHWVRYGVKAADHFQHTRHQS